MEPGKQYAPVQNVVERLGLNFLRGRVEREASNIHIWSDAERKAIRRIERQMIFMAAVAGSVSGFLIGSAEIAFSRSLLGPETAGWIDSMPYWSAYLGVTLLVSAAEILYLYRAVLHSVARVSSVAGLGLTDDEIEQVMARGLSRAALELPNPRMPVYGIDPYARTSRWKLVAYTILYRVKVGATSFILRILLRRLLARASLRAFIPLIAIPVYAAWNAAVIRWVMREARVRAAGPIAVEDFGQLLARERDRLGPEVRRLILEAVGECIIRSEDAHPNFVLLLTRFFQDLEMSPSEVRIDWNRTREGLSKLDRTEQDLVLAALILTALIDGRMRRAETGLLEEAHTACGRPFQAGHLLDISRRLLDGQGITAHLPDLAPSRLRKPSPRPA